MTVRIDISDNNFIINSIVRRIIALRSQLQTALDNINIDNVYVLSMKRHVAALQRNFTDSGLTVSQIRDAIANRFNYPELTNSDLSNLNTAINDVANWVVTNDDAFGITVDSTTGVWIFDTPFNSTLTDEITALIQTAIAAYTPDV